MITLLRMIFFHLTLLHLAILLHLTIFDITLLYPTLFHLTLRGQHHFIRTRLPVTSCLYTDKNLVPAVFHTGTVVGVFPGYLYSRVSLIEWSSVSTRYVATSSSLTIIYYLYTTLTCVDCLYRLKIKLIQKALNLSVNDGGILVTSK